MSEVSEASFIDMQGDTGWPPHFAKNDREIYSVLG
jgi:hypothetical protein